MQSKRKRIISIIHGLLVVLLMDFNEKAMTIINNNNLSQFTKSFKDYLYLPSKT